MEGLPTVLDGGEVPAAAAFADDPEASTFRVVRQPVAWREMSEYPVIREGLLAKYTP
jgi:hypothetical protein